MPNLKSREMKNKHIKIILLLPLCLYFSQCDVLDQEPISVAEVSTFYDSPSAAEIGLVGCYNRFFQESGYSRLIMYLQASSDDVKQPNGFAFQMKDRSQLTANPASGGGYDLAWKQMYEAIANVNYLIEQVALIPDQDFVDPTQFPDRNRKTEILAEAHFLRGIVYYYLTMTWRDVPLILKFPEGGPEDNYVAKSTQAEILAQVKDDLMIAEEDLPDVITNYVDGNPTNQRKGKASKWAAKAYLARIALWEKDWQKALELSNEIINSGQFSFTPNWVDMFIHPMNASESIFEQQNDFSPGFFGSGTFGWFFGYDFEWTESALELYEKPDTIGVTQGKDVRFDNSYAPHPWGGTDNLPRKHVPPEGFENGGVESMNFVLVRLSEIYFIKAEALTELNYEGNKAEVLDILNMMRERTRDEDFVNRWFSTAPVGTVGISVLTQADVDTREKMQQAIRDEKRRELMWEDGTRWIDLLRWDKDYAMQITNADSEDMLYLPIHSDEILRNPKLAQNPAY